MHSVRERRAPSHRYLGGAIGFGLTLVGSWLVGCEPLDDRQLDPPADEVGSLMGGLGGSGGSSGGSAGSAGSGGTSSAGALPGAGGSSEVRNVPVISLASNGQSCQTGEACESSRCEATASAGAQVCCALDCPGDARCSADGSRCEPLPRALGQACGEGLGCVAGLACMQAAVGQSVCCASTCQSGEFCVDQGARCAAPLRVTGATCTESGQCISGYCGIDRKVCAVNPCEGVPTGKYCGRGAQCDAAGLCAFTGMGIVSGGSAHTCAVLSNGNVRCWGNNENGELGVLPEQLLIGDAPEEIPSQVAGLELSFDGRRAVQVSAGGFHSCALLEDGNVRCWGRNTETQLVPTRQNGGDIFLPRGETAAQIDTGGGHTCALLDSGQVTCWGFNTTGQDGFGHNQPLANADLGIVALPERAKLVTAGAASSCAVLESGALSCWGQGANGVLGYGEASSRFAPMGNVDVGGPVIYAAIGSRVTCVVITGGFVRCWGDNASGILGYAHAEDIGLLQTPAQAATLTAANGRPLGGDVALGGGGVVQVEVNTDSGHVCARFSGGAVRCWGDNNSGSLGYGHLEDIGDDETPAQAALFGPNQLGGDVPFGQSVLALATGGRCAVLLDRSLICWGRNSQGQLGLPALFPAGTPDLTPLEVIQSGIGPVSIE